MTELTRIIIRAKAIARRGGGTDYPEGRAFHPAALVADAAIEIGGEALRDRLLVQFSDLYMRASPMTHPLIGHTQAQAEATLDRMLDLHTQEAAS